MRTENINRLLEVSIYEYLQILDLSVDIPRSQADPTEWLQQA